MKFLVPNYSYLQNPWVGGYRPQIPVLSLLSPQLNLLNPPQTKFLGTPLHCIIYYSKLDIFLVSLMGGVKQGDPPPSFIFSAILEQFEQMKGYVIDESHSLSALAFTDGLILLATAKEKVQSLLHHSESYLINVGMHIAAEECASLEIRPTKDSWYIANPDLHLTNGGKYHPQLPISPYAIWEVTFRHGLGCNTETLWISWRLHLNYVGVPN